MKYFTLDEFRCKCGLCGGDPPMNPAFLSRLDLAREFADVPFVVTSGYRCDRHNKAVGSTSSNHVRGVAADIQAKDGPTRGAILRGLYLAGFKRIGIGKIFIHCDTNTGPESCWLY